MKLRHDINLGTLAGLPRDSIGWRASRAQQFEMLQQDGVDVVQAWNGWDEIQRAGLRASGMAGMRRPEQAEEIARAHKAAGLVFTNVHIGSGFDSDAEMDALATALLEAQAKHGQTMLVETHRATATQDIWRTLRWIERFPELRFTADLSHWYSGHEMTYGEQFAERMALLQPVFERCRAVHGRIGNSGCLQTPLDRPGDYLAHYRQMWTAVCRGFQAHAQPGDELSFAAELLPMREGGMWLHYQQQADENGPEPCDRYADALRLWQLMQDCWRDASSPTERSALP